MLDIVRCLPDTAIYYALKKATARNLQGFPEDHVEKSTNYAHILIQHGAKSDNEKAITASFKYGLYAKHPTTSADRLGNSDLQFPIAYAFGDRDWVGSDGAEKIVQQNKYFKEGLSQIFVIPHADHMTHINNGDALVEKIVGFFNQTIRHEFEYKPRVTHPLIIPGVVPKQFLPKDEPLQGDDFDTDIDTDSDLSIKSVNNLKEKTKCDSMDIGMAEPDKMYK